MAEQHASLGSNNAGVVVVVVALVLGLPCLVGLLLYGSWFMYVVGSAPQREEEPVLTSSQKDFLKPGEEAPSPAALQPAPVSP